MEPGGAGDLLPLGSAPLVADRIAGASVGIMAAPVGGVGPVTRPASVAPVIVWLAGFAMARLESTYGGWALAPEAGAPMGSETRGPAGTSPPV